jgi:serine/threonine-protein kinase RsbW
MTLELHATAEEVMRAVGALEEFGRARGIGEKEVFAMMLALEESGSNIVQHALGRDGRQMFRVTVEHLGNFLKVELRDGGPEFDPTRAILRPPSDEDPPGGLGMQLARRFVDEIHYQRDGNENVLSLMKRLNRNQLWTE